MQDKNIFDYKQFLKYFIIMSLVLTLSFIIVISIIEKNKLKIEKNEIESNENRVVQLEEFTIGKEFNSIINDLHYLTDIFLESQLIGNSHLENEWKVFSEKQKIYDQIRYIDNTGKERIRINYSNEGARIVPKSELQDKKNRYYFNETLNLDEGKIYVSKFDLNVEKGQVEFPIKPILRFSTPIYNKDGLLKGIIVLNYYAKNILESFETISKTSFGEVYLLNSSGYWLYNIDAKKEWSFMYDNKKEMNFINEYPKEWELIKNGEGTSYTRNGLFTYADLIVKDKINKKDYENIILGEGNWKIVSYISKSGEHGYIINNNILDIITAIIINKWLYSIIILFISISFSLLMVANKKSIERIRYFSEFDEMTNVLNRRAGIERLENSLSKKNFSKISVCFLDINGLKNVNDTFGHEEGDRLILTIVNGIKKYIRQTDFITRLGGDEFLIAFPNTSEKEAENIWLRILNEYERINKEENRKYLVSASHGIAEYEMKGKSYIDEFINLADERMYNEKREIKSNIEIIRN